MEGAVAGVPLLLAVAGLAAVVVAVEAEAGPAEASGWYAAATEAAGALRRGGVSGGWSRRVGGRGAAPRRRAATLFLLGVLLSSLLNVISCQKYYDGLILLFLLWRSEGEAARDPGRRRLLCGLILLFCVYAAAFPFLAKSETVVMTAPTLPPP